MAVTPISWGIITNDTFSSGPAQAGDYMLVHLAQIPAEIDGVGVGSFTLLAKDTSTSQRHSLWGRLITAGDIGDGPWETGGDGGSYAVFRGVDPAAPIAALYGDHPEGSVGHQGGVVTAPSIGSIGGSWIGGSLAVATFEVFGGGLTFTTPAGYAGMTGAFGGGPYGWGDNQNYAWFTRSSPPKPTGSASTTVFRSGSSSGMSWLQHLVLQPANVAPTPGNVIAPNGGETYVVGATITLSGSTVVDGNGDQVDYLWEWSANGDAGPWTQIGSSSTSPNKAWNTAGLIPGSNYKVRRRTYDGFVHSAYDASDGPFTLLAGGFQMLV